MASGTVVPLLLQAGLAVTWCGLGVLAMLLTGLAWGRDHARAARVDEVHGDTTDGVGQRARPCPHRIGQPEDVGLVVSPERHPDIP